MRVSVVIRKSWDGWVLRKIGLNLVSGLNQLGIEADYVTDPDPKSNINHFLHFGFAEAVPNSISTMMITHVDDAIKAKRVKALLNNGVNGGVCMSSFHMEELIKYGIPAEKLSFALPALDETVLRRIHFTIQCNCYRDGRKNESFFKQLADSVDLGFAEFSFFGSGWEEIAVKLEKAGAEVALHPPSGDFTHDYRAMIEALKTADYYVNPGWDEGSLGSLDAFINRTRMILSSQGYHLNIPDRNSYFFNNYLEFREIFTSVAAEHATKQVCANNMSWLQYSKNHLTIWEGLLRSGKLSMPLNLNYGVGTVDFDKYALTPILDLSFRKTFRRAMGITTRKFKIDRR